MAQALVDLTYFKCGHCQQKFNSLAAFGKHQKEVHMPKNAPKMKTVKEVETPLEPMPKNTPAVKEEVPMKVVYEYDLILKLC